MSFQESELSDLLEHDDREALYNNVNDIVNYVQDNLYDPALSDLANAFPIGNEETLTFKQEIFNEIPLPQPDMSYTPQLPPVYSVPLKVCNEEYAGPFNFEVSVIPNGSKNPWVYSTMLNKVYIDMGAHFPVDFRLNTQDIANLYIRVTPSFSSLQFSQELVYRCVQHEQCQFNKDVPPHVRQHIIRCPSNDKTCYLGDREKNQRLSVLFPLSHPPTGMDSVREMFVFVCKNSCPTGMNRKSIEIIFTLERFDGEILGRKTLNVRICSCPKRDKEKEERDMNKSSPSQAKRRKTDMRDKRLSPELEPSDRNTYNVYRNAHSENRNTLSENRNAHSENRNTLSENRNALIENRNAHSENRNAPNENRNPHSVTIDVPTKAHALQILKLSQDLMAGEVMRNPRRNDEFVSAYNKLQVQINQLQQ